MPKKFKFKKQKGSLRERKLKRLQNRKPVVGGTRVDAEFLNQVQDDIRQAILNA